MRQTSNDLKEAARLVSRACAYTRLHARAGAYTPSLACWCALVRIHAIAGVLALPLSWLHFVTDCACVQACARGRKKNTARDLRQPRRAFRGLVCIQSTFLLAVWIKPRQGLATLKKICLCCWGVLVVSY